MERRIFLYDFIGFNPRPVNSPDDTWDRLRTYGGKLAVSIHVRLIHRTIRKTLINIHTGFSFNPRPVNSPDDTGTELLDQVGIIEFQSTSG